MITRFFTTLLIAICSTVVMTACTSRPGSKDSGKPSTTQTTTDMNGKRLVVYFSHTGENYNVGYITEGNTRIVADMIADATGADRFEIVPVNGYPRDSYDECIAVAKRELQQKGRPAVKGDIAIEDYDVIFIGYPQWWGEPPMCVYTFIEKHDWSGKTVIPFVTHEGSGMGGNDRNIADACKGATVAIGKGLAIKGTTAQNNRESTRKTVTSWLTGLGIK